MASPPPARELDEFLTELQDVSSRGDRAVAAAYIRDHETAIREFIRRKRVEGQLEAAEHFEAMIASHVEGPFELWFDSENGVLRSFRISPRNEVSFTLAARHPWARRVGYGLTVLILVCILFLGWKVYEFGVHYFTARAERTVALANGDTP